MGGARPRLQDLLLRVGAGRGVRADLAAAGGRDRDSRPRARLDGRLVGIAHYVFHPAVWSGEACYLQDLFTDEAARGRGAARALIEAVAAAARERGADRLYWHTQQSNTRARVLYDKVARFTGFIRYAYPL